jgi:PPOX class probable F420-dependent enzyme
MKMDEQEARRRLEQARVGRLATVTPTGSPHVVPVVFALLGDVLYTAVDGKPKTTMALRRLDNIEATGVASLLVDEYSEDWSTLWWVRVDGSAQVLTPDHSDVAVAVQALTRKYPQYVRHPPTGPVISMDVARWQGWEAAGNS